jgi:outer membrane protein assembly factor BamE (lipoprotein component of BamABCDE complex)
MNARLCVSVAGFALYCFAARASVAENVARPPASATFSEHTLSQVLPGRSTKTQVLSLLGEPWRIVQFNDCGHAMPGQADETWDYRGKDAKGTYRIHIEFDEEGVTHLVAKIPDVAVGGRGTTAKIAPDDPMKAMQMSAKR